MHRVLIVDDEPVFLTSLGMLLAQEGFEVETAADAAKAVELGTGFAPHLLIVDWLLRGSVGGVEVARLLRRSRPNLRVILMSGCAASRLSARLEALGEATIMEKPFSPGALLDAVRAMAGGD